MQREAKFKERKKKRFQREKKDRTLKTPPMTLENSNSAYTPRLLSKNLGARKKKAFLKLQ